MTTARNSRVLWTIPLLISIFSLSLPAYAKYSSGTGEPNDPYQIATAEQLISIGSEESDPNLLYKHFILLNDIDLDPNLPDGQIFDRAVIPKFSGTFDGNSFIISNLTIVGDSDLGLFGKIKEGAQINHLSIVDASVVGSGQRIGILSGSNGDHSRRGGRIIDCFVSGKVSGENYVGGLMGENIGSITTSYSTGTIIGVLCVGGLVGGNYGSIAMSYSAGVVSGKGTVGGLAGDSTGITASYSTSMVSGNFRVGGLVGRNVGSITVSYSTGTVIGNENVGGLVGSNEWEGDIIASFWDIETSGQVKSAGGTGLTTDEMKDITAYMNAGWDFWGESENGLHEIWTISEDSDYPVLSVFHGFEPPTLSGDGTNDFPYLISSASELGAVLYHKPNAFYQMTTDIDLSGVTWSMSVIPALSGSFNGQGLTIRNLTIIGNRGLGLIGTLMPGAEVRNLGVTNANIAGKGSEIGIIIGYNHWGSVLNCYSAGTAEGDENVGGLIGESFFGEVNSSYSASTIRGERLVGGLIGYNKSGKISNSYSTSTVIGERLVGGLTGYNAEGSILNCYNSGPVSGEKTVGGLVGWNRGQVLNCYSNGMVGGNVDVGGLVGSGDDVNYSFWDIETSGQLESVAGSGLASAAMKDITTYLNAGWDFIDETENSTEDIWFIPEQDYPHLTWELLDFSQRISISKVDTRIGKIIRTKGMTQLGRILCTAMGCAESCCNTCGSSLILNSTEGPLELIGEDISCIGTDCSITCSPIQAGREYIIEGILRDPMTLEVIDYEEIPYIVTGFIIVDDFEFYNRIYLTWIDGWDDPNNGAIVGHAKPPFAERIIVHGGAQSMPLFYHNSGPANYSETTRTLTNQRDWTEAGVEILSIWFHGDLSNAPETMYVVLNGTAGVDNDNPNATQLDTWTEWRIDLQAFADQGVNLTNINTITIGFGNRDNPQPGGEGIMYFDDIRLYRSAP